MPQLPMISTQSLAMQDSNEYQYLSDVVRIGFPIRAARSFLARHYGNKITQKLVEVSRGEEVGNVRKAEVISCDGGPKITIDVVRALPDGTPASFFTPKELLTIYTRMETDNGEPVPPLRSGDTIILFVPVRSYLRFLPGLYRGSAPMMRRDVTRYDDRSQLQLSKKDHSITTRVSIEQTTQFRRFLLLFQHMMTSVLDEIDNISVLIDPLRVDAKFLPWLASWVNFHFDASLPLHQQREMIRRAIKLQRMRGTSAGVAEMVRILTSTPVEIIERTKPNACYIGKMTLSGGKRIENRFLRREKPGSYIVSPSRKEMAFFIICLESMGKFHKRFGERVSDILRQIIQIVTREMPAHVVFTIRFEGNP